MKEDVVRIVNKAFLVSKDIFKGFPKPLNLRLEEVILDKDKNTWSIVLGYNTRFYIYRITQNVFERKTIKEIKRKYLVFSFDANTGNLIEIHSN